MIVASDHDVTIGDICAIVGSPGNTSTTTVSMPPYTIDVGTNVTVLSIRKAFFMFNNKACYEVYCIDSMCRIGWVWHDELTRIVT